MEGIQMHFFDMIKELREGKPNRKKTVKNLYIFGAIFIVIAAGNYLVSCQQKDAFFSSNWHTRLIALYFMAGILVWEHACH